VNSLGAARRARRLLEIDVGKRLAVVVPDDEAGVALLGDQGGGKLGGAVQSITTAVIGSPSSSVPVSIVLAVNGISMPETRSRCFLTARRVFLTLPARSRSASTASTVSAVRELGQG
jgi:hypothetical protein